MNIFGVAGSMTLDVLMAEPADNLQLQQAQEQQSFGKLADALLIGNFGDGHINGFNATTGNFIGTMHYGQSTIGLQRPLSSMAWGPLKVGNDQNGKSGHANVLYFTAGPNGEADGLFGALAPDGLYGTPPYPFRGP